MKETKRLKGPERKKQILISAVSVFARSNYQSARMADIAAEVGVSEAAVYRYFPSKKDVYLEILQHISQRIIDFWQEEFDREDDALEVLRNMGRTYFQRMSRHPAELKVQFQAVAEVRDPRIKERLRQDHLGYMAFIGRVIRKGQDQGRVRPDLDPDNLAWLFDGVGILLNMTRLLSFGETYDQRALDSLVEHILNSIRM